MILSSPAIASSTSLLNTPVLSHSVRRLRKVVSPAGLGRAATSQEQAVTSRTKMGGEAVPVGDARSVAAQRFTADM